MEIDTREVTRTYRFVIQKEYVSKFESNPTIKDDIDNGLTNNDNNHTFGRILTNEENNKI